MKLRPQGLLFLLTLMLFSTACAQSRRVVKSGMAYAKVLGATSERYLPGRAESQPITNYRITIQWQSMSKPTGFFWRPESGLMNCLVVKPGGSDVDVAPESLRPNQTVDLVPTPDATRTPIPSFVSASVPNTLFFQIGKTWYAIPVKLTKKQDLIAQ